MDNSTVVSTATKIKQAKRLIRILISLPTCSIAVPVQLFCLFILFRYKDFRENASFQLVARLVILDLLQAIALFISGLYAVDPSLTEFQPLQKLCGVALTCFFMALFPLQFELTIYRMMVVTRACKHQKLPIFIKLAEGVLWIFIAVLSVGCYRANAYVFTAPSWDYDTDTFVGAVLSGMELFFCIPFLVVTYVLYMFLISMVFMEKKLFTKYKNPKEEWFLFIQSTTSTMAHLIQISLYHIPDIWPDLYDSPSYFFISRLNYHFSLYWTTIFLICNRNVRKKILEFVRGTDNDVFRSSETR